MQIKEWMSVNNDCYKKNVAKADSRYTTFQKRGPLGLMLHSVGTPQPDAAVFARGWNVSGKEVAVHGVLQADGLVYQCLPWNYRGWHCAGDANNTHVGVEMTEPASIRYTSGAKFVVNDREDALKQVRGTYKTAVDLFAYLCDKYDLDPLVAIISHAEGAKRGLASSHGDPEHLWNGLGIGYTMDGFRKDVAAKLKEMREPQLTEAETRKLFNEMFAAQPKPKPTKEEILEALGDKWISKFSDLPKWAQKEIRPLIEMGALKGTKPASSVEDTQIDGTLNTLVRPMIVSERMVNKMMENE